MLKNEKSFLMQGRKCVGIIFILFLVGLFSYFSLDRVTQLPIGQNFLKAQQSQFVRIVPIPSDWQRCEETCSPHDTMCQAVDYDGWKKVLTGPEPRFKPFPPGGKIVFPWEKQLLAFPPLSDNKTLPDLVKSKFSMVGGNDNKIQCKVGDRLVGRVDLFDSYGRNRLAGLDEVRAWIVDVDYPKRRATAQVTDLRNGSYAIGVTCLWAASKAKLYVAVSYPREFLRLVVHQGRHGAGRYTVGRFTSSDGVVEDTVCNPTPNIPGRSCLCNFTAFNGREFYCGQPRNSRLNCSDWKSTMPLPFSLPYHVTEAEKEVIKNMPGSFKRRTLKTEYLFETSQATVLRARSLPSCFKVSSEVTWDYTTQPKGFWDLNGAWQTLLCERQYSKPLAGCLKDSHVYVIGDSNGVRIYSAILRSTTSKSVIPGQWPRPAKARNEGFNITVEFRAHDYPLFLGGRWETVLTSGSVESQIDAIPSTGRQILILHYYLHVVAFHLSVAKSRLEAAAEAIRRLLQRNPNAYVAFRGPHVSSRDWNYNHCVGGDPLGRYYLDIIYQAFSGLRHRVVFLDGWEMTTALENEEFHPTDKVPEEMLKTFQAFICE